MPVASDSEEDILDILEDHVSEGNSHIVLLGKEKSSSTCVQLKSLVQKFVTLAGSGVEYWCQWEERALEYAAVEEEDNDFGDDFDNASSPRSKKNINKSKSNSSVTSLVALNQLVASAKECPFKISQLDSLLGLQNRCIFMDNRMRSVLSLTGSAAETDPSCLTLDTFQSLDDEIQQSLPGMQLSFAPEFSFAHQLYQIVWDYKALTHVLDTSNPGATKLVSPADESDRVSIVDVLLLLTRATANSFCSFGESLQSLCVHLLAKVQDIQTQLKSLVTEAENLCGRVILCLVDNTASTDENFKSSLRILRSSPFIISEEQILEQILESRELQSQAAASVKVATADDSNSSPTFSLSSRLELKTRIRQFEDQFSRAFASEEKYPNISEERTALRTCYQSYCNFLDRYSVPWDKLQRAVEMCGVGDAPTMKVFEALVDGAMHCGASCDSITADASLLLNNANSFVNDWKVVLDSFSSGVISSSNIALLNDKVGIAEHLPLPETLKAEIAAMSALCNIAFGCADSVTSIFQLNLHQVTPGSCMTLPLNNFSVIQGRGLLALKKKLDSAYHLAEKLNLAIRSVVIMLFCKFYCLHWRFSVNTALDNSSTIENCISLQNEGTRLVRLCKLEELCSTREWQSLTTVIEESTVLQSSLQKLSSRLTMAKNETRVNFLELCPQQPDDTDELRFGRVRDCFFSQSASKDSDLLAQPHVLDAYQSAVKGWRDVVDNMPRELNDIMMKFKALKIHLSDKSLSESFVVIDVLSAAVTANENIRAILTTSHVFNGPKGGGVTYERLLELTARILKLSSDDSSFALLQVVSACLNQYISQAQRWSEYAASLIPVAKTTRNKTRADCKTATKKMLQDALHQPIVRAIQALPMYKEIWSTLDGANAIVSSELTRVLTGTNQQIEDSEIDNDLFRNLCQVHGLLQKAQLFPIELPETKLLEWVNQVYIWMQTVPAPHDDVASSAISLDDAQKKLSDGVTVSSMPAEVLEQLIDMKLWNDEAAKGPVGYTSAACYHLQKSLLLYNYLTTHISNAVVTESKISTLVNDIKNATNEHKASLVDSLKRHYDSIASMVVVPRQSILVQMHYALGFIQEPDPVVVQANPKLDQPLSKSKRKAILIDAGDEDVTLVNSDEDDWISPEQRKSPSKSMKKLKVDRLEDLHLTTKSHKKEKSGDKQKLKKEKDLSVKLLSSPASNSASSSKHGHDRVRHKMCAVNSCSSQVASNSSYCSDTCAMKSCGGLLKSLLRYRQRILLASSLDDSADDFLAHQKGVMVSAQDISSFATSTLLYPDAVQGMAAGMMRCGYQYRDMVDLTAATGTDDNTSLEKNTSTGEEKILVESKTESSDIALKADESNVINMESSEVVDASVVDTVVVAATNETSVNEGTKESVEHTLNISTNVDTIRDSVVSKKLALSDDTLTELGKRSRPLTTKSMLATLPQAAESLYGTVTGGSLSSPRPSATASQPQDLRVLVRQNMESSLDSVITRMGEPGPLTYAALLSYELEEELHRTYVSNNNTSADYDKKSYKTHQLMLNRNLKQLHNEELVKNDYALLEYYMSSNVRQLMEGKLTAAAVVAMNLDELANPELLKKREAKKQEALATAKLTQSTETQMASRRQLSMSGKGEVWRDRGNISEMSTTANVGKQEAMIDAGAAARAAGGTTIASATAGPRMMGGHSGRKLRKVEEEDNYPVLPVLAPPVPAKMQTNVLKMLQSTPSAAPEVTVLPTVPTRTVPGADVSPSMVNVPVRLLSATGSKGFTVSMKKTNIECYGVIKDRRLQGIIKNEISVDMRLPNQRIRSFLDQKMASKSRLIAPFKLFVPMAMATESTSSYRMFCDRNDDTVGLFDFAASSSNNVNVIIVPPRYKHHYPILNTLQAPAVSGKSVPFGHGVDDGDSTVLYGIVVSQQMGPPNLVYAPCKEVVSLNDDCPPASYYVGQSTGIDSTPQGSPENTSMVELAIFVTNDNTGMQGSAEIIRGLRSLPDSRVSIPFIFPDDPDFRAFDALVQQRLLALSQVQ